MRKNIIFCGGGSGGHVLPAVTLIKELKEAHPTSVITCIGSHNGIEASLLADYNYISISTGKLRRYFSFENLLDFFKVILGTIQAFYKLLSFSRSETIIVSTGGFVTIPVIIAAWLQGKPILLHEQTTRAGLANQIASIFARKCLLTFEESLEFFPKGKSIWVGYPLRKEIFHSSTKLESIEGYNEHQSLPILFLTGGGNGSKLLNETLKKILPVIESKYFVIHQCGKAFIEDYKKLETSTYKVFDFIDTDMITLLKNSSVVISRAGAGTVCELLALGKPSILIPLKIAQKNEQFHNAVVAKKKMGSILIEESELNPEKLLDSIHSIQNIKSIEGSSSNPITKILEEIGQV